MNEMVLSATGRVYGQRMASSDGVRGFIYGTTTGQTAYGHAQACFYKDSQVARRALPEGTNNYGITELQVALMPGAFITASKSIVSATYAKTVITEYPVADPLASDPLVAGTVYMFGDSESRRSEFVTLNDGRLLCATVQQTLQAVDFALRTAPGIWVYLGRFFVPGTYGNSHEFCVVQDVDDSIWAYIITDGGWIINAMRLFLVGATLTLDQAFPRWINNDSVNGVYKFGRMVVNGEIPAIRAIQDKANSRQLLAYPSREGVLVNGFNKAFPVLTAVALDGTPTFVQMSTRLMPPNAYPVGLSLPGVMTYVETELTGAETKLVQIALDGSVSELADVSSINFTWAADSQDVAYVASAGAVTLQWNAPPVPVPPLLLPLSFTKHGNQLTFTWTGAGTLQKSVTATGPWKAVASQSPYVFQANNGVSVDPFMVRTQKPVAYFRAVAV